MPGWLVRGDEELGFYGVEEVLVRVDGGKVTVAPVHGPTTCAVRRIDGEPVIVRQEGGSLRVLHPQPVHGWDVPDPVRGLHTAEVWIGAPPGVVVRVIADSADVEIAGLGGVEAQSATGRVRELALVERAG